MKKILIGFLQVLILTLFTFLMEKISALLHLPIPGSMIGLIVLFILLKTNVVKLKWIDLGGSWLVAEMLLFFIPSAVGVIRYGDLMLDNGWKVIAVIILSSSAVMIGSGMLAEKMARQKEVKVNHASNDGIHSYH